MSKNRIPSYRLHRPSRRAVVTLNGKDFYLGPWNSEASRIEYERLISEWLSNGRQLPSANGCGNLSIAELQVAYWRFAKGYYVKNGRPSKEQLCMREALRPLKELYSHTTVRDFGPVSLKALQRKMIESGYCRTHINHQINRICRVFKWGVENELVPAEIYQALRAVAPLKRGRTEARESKPVKPVAEEHVEPVLPHVSRQVAAMIRLQQLAGMRSGEVVLMRPCDVDTGGIVWVYTPDEHKTAYRGHRREIYLGPRAQEILKPWLDRNPKAYCFSPVEAEEERNKKRRKAPSAHYKRRRKPRRPRRAHYDTDSYRQAIGYGIKKAGVPHWHPHQLRHSAGTRIRQASGLDAAQIILGHRSAQTTEIYAEADQAKAIAVIRKIG